MKTAEQIIKEAFIDKRIERGKVEPANAEAEYNETFVHDGEGAEIIGIIKSAMKAYAEQVIDECVEEFESCYYDIDYAKYSAFKRSILNVKNLLK